MVEEWLKQYSNESKEDNRGQEAYTEENIFEIIEAMVLPNVTPQQILFFIKQKWISMIKNEKTIREVLYGDSNKRDSTPELLEEIKRNRVTVAHRES